MGDFIRLLFAISSHICMLAIGVITLYFNAVWFKERTICLCDFIKAVFIAVFFLCCFYFGLQFVVFGMNVAGGAQ